MPQFHRPPHEPQPPEVGLSGVQARLRTTSNTRQPVPQPVPILPCHTARPAPPRLSQSESWPEATDGSKHSTPPKLLSSSVSLAFACPPARPARVKFASRMGLGHHPPEIIHASSEGKPRIPPGLSEPFADRGPRPSPPVDVSLGALGPAPRRGRSSLSPLLSRAADRRRITNRRKQAVQCSLPTPASSVI